MEVVWLHRKVHFHIVALQCIRAAGLEAGGGVGGGTRQNVQVVQGVRPRELLERVRHQGGPEAASDVHGQEVMGNVKVLL